MNFNKMVVVVLSHIKTNIYGIINNAIYNKLNLW